MGVGVVKKALITGVTGQDGSYLAEFLISKGYEVHGLIRRASSLNTKRIHHLCGLPHDQNADLLLHYGDLTDSSGLNRLLEKIGPDEIYNLGAQSHVQVSFEMPEYTAEVDALGALRLLDAIKETGLKEQIRFFQASSSEIYGEVHEIPQTETTAFCPRSPYGVAKLYAYWMTVNYRKAYSLHASNGIFFNHESPRRGEMFVTRKIAQTVVAILRQEQECLHIGNLDAKRDWGYAPEFVEAMWLMLQQDQPDDYVIATGESHSVREFIERAFSFLGATLEWHGTGLNETAVIKSFEPVFDFKLSFKKGVPVVRVDPAFLRPMDVELLMGDPTKAKHVLGWEPKVRFNDLVRIMMEAALADHATSFQNIGNLRFAPF